jgi:hypothetical protein
MSPMPPLPFSPECINQGRVPVSRAPAIFTRWRWPLKHHETVSRVQADRISSQPT